MSAAPPEPESERTVLREQKSDHVRDITVTCLLGHKSLRDVMISVVQFYFEESRLGGDRESR